MENFIQLTLPDLTSLALNPMNFQCYEYRTNENILNDLFNFYKVIRNKNKATEVPKKIQERRLQRYRQYGQLDKLREEI